ncbi:isochorismate synthase [Tessaracoccus antarcticus]|uniref:isochorismate synthase n=1 Tax=Tessaracoccus antarcticus TaxID=2479848 RepID=A0A3M0G281_9ACTN|nr:isochorismate synthase [Tessaracoccus antarcticus]RMB58227.1 isochorismate synthase [Tessaracoccus antarcticus]
MSLDFSTKRMRATTVAIPDPGLLQRFLSASGPTSAFIRRGEGFVALGEVARFETDYPDAADVWWAEVADHIDHDSELPGAYGTSPLAVGSFTFDPDRSEERSVLVVPEVVIGTRGGQSWMTTIGPRSRSLELPPSGERLVAPTHLDLLEGSMSERIWMDIVGEVVALIRTGEVDKVVLARDLVVKAGGPLDARWLVNRLVNRYPTCWTYLVDGLVGATPELLIRRQGGLATSRVLAGTVSLDPQNTDSLVKAAELATSSKDVAEHEFAVESVARALEPYCSAMNVPESPSILRLPNVLHLSTDITGVTDPGSSALALAAALHPSAAVCGTPTFAARDVISELESMDRGRYAGPVGWVDSFGDGEWAIALRGGQIKPETPEQIQLFAGCGLVADSDPAAELAETKAKFLPMLQALGLAD